MNKVSIAMYSTFKRPGWKSDQLEEIVPLLKRDQLFCKGYGLGGFRRRNNDADIVTAFLPLIASKLIKKIENIFPIPGYADYLSGEYILGMLMKNRVKDDLSNIIYCKPRPLSIITSCKSKNKKVVMEFGEMHPEYTAKKLEDDYLRFKINSRYIFSSRYAIEQSKKSIDLADRIIVLSKASKQSFIDYGVAPEKLRVVGLGRGKKYIELETKEKPFAFISTAYHSFVKGTHRLLMAWRCAEIKNIPLIIVGNLQKDIVEFIKMYGPFDNVQFVGHQNVHEIYRQYKAVGILNSLSEGYGRSVIEYMAFGFPVIVTPVATCDIVVDGENGFVVNSDEELVCRLKQFSDSVELLKTMGEAARISIDRMPGNSYASGFLKIIEELT